MFFCLMQAPPKLQANFWCGGKSLLSYIRSKKEVVDESTTFGKCEEGVG